MNIFHAAAETETHGGFPWWANGIITFAILTAALYVVTRFNQDR